MPHGDAVDATASLITAAPAVNEVPPASAGNVADAVIPAVGLSKPPLARKARAPRPKPTRSLKQREREFPNVDWDNALLHFATCVYDDLQDLNTRFVSEHDITFAAFKHLWLDARMTASFHVEFWESTASNTHKAILQQALDALVVCIENHSGDFEAAADVAALVGHVFALYCAYSVQLGEPKHKIDVDPRSWTALLTIGCAASGVGTVLFPQAAREVRAIMRHLVTTEDAFLRCLRGFGPSVRAKHHITTFRTNQIDSQQNESDRLSVVSDADDEEPLVKKEELKRLGIMSERYLELVSRARSASASAVGLGSRARGISTQKQTAAPQLGLSMLQDVDVRDEGLLGALGAYASYKDNSEARRKDRAVRAAAAREYDTNNILLLEESSELNESSSTSAPPSPFPPSTASSLQRKRSESIGGDSDSFLAELESELHADIANDAVEPPPRTYIQGTEERQLDESFLTDSRDSDTESDELEELELELQQNVGATLPQQRGAVEALPFRPKGTRALVRTASTKKRTRAPKTAAATSTPSPRREPLSQATRQVKSGSVASNLSSAASWDASSTVDSDGLAGLQAELDAVPSIGARTDEPGAGIARSAHATAGDKTKHAVAPSASAQQRVATTGIQPRVTVPAIKRADGPARRQRASAKRQQNRVGRIAPSATPEGSDQLSRSKKQLNSAARLQTSRASTASGVRQGSSAVTSARPSEPDHPSRIRRSARLNSISSDTNSDGLADLEAELANDAGYSALTPTARQASTSGTETTKPQKQVGTITKLPARRVVPTQQKVMPTSTSLQTIRRSSRLSSIVSESDGLAELEAELVAFAAPPVSAPSTRPVVVSKPETKKTQQRLTVRANRPAGQVATTRKKAKMTTKQQTTKNGEPMHAKALQCEASVEPLAGPRAEHSGTATRQPNVRRSSRLSSVASDTESDGLAELEAELKSSIWRSTPLSLQVQAQAPLTKSTSRPKAAKKTVPSTAKQPARRATAAAKRPARQMVTSRKKAKTTGHTASTRPDAIQHKTAGEPPATTKPGQGSLPTSLRSVRRSSRLNFVVSDSGSDGLAELEAELNPSIAPRVPVSVPATTTKTWGKPANLTSKRPARQTSAVRSTSTKTKTTAASKTPSPSRRIQRSPRAATEQPRVVTSSQEPDLSPLIGVRRPTRLSSVASDMESDGLAELEAELGSTPAFLSAPIPASTTRRRLEPLGPAKPSAPKRATRRVPAPTRRETRQLAMKPRATIAASKSRATDPVDARTGATGDQEQQRAPAVHPSTRAKEPSMSSPSRQPRTRRSTRSSSMASDTESDGLAELEAELQAGTG